MWIAFINNCWFRRPGAISIGFHLGCCNNVVFVHFVFLGCLFYGLVTVTQCYTYCILYITSIINTYSCHLYLFMTLLYDFDLFSSCSSILFYFPGLPSSQRGLERLGCRKSNEVSYVSSCFLGFAWAFYFLNLWNQRQRRKHVRFSPRFLLKCSTRPHLFCRTALGWLPGSCPGSGRTATARKPRLRGGAMDRQRSPAMAAVMRRWGSWGLGMGMMRDGGWGTLW